MKVVMIRHGKTPGNLLKQYIGRTDQSLADEGIKELKAIASSEEFKQTLDSEKVEKIFVTPLKRTQETAAILFPNARQMIINDLREMDFGIFEEKNYIDLEHSKEYAAWLDTHCESKVPEGEDKASFSKRSCNAFLQCMKDNRDEVVYFLVHGGTIMSVMEAFAETRQEYYKWYAENGHGYMAEWDGSVLSKIQAV
ncbi:MAG: histidine phosphatase family protein [Lachnospiraceae bacterium]|nr:histidine phosphatase family protein [Lachnospiraceae bacterium]